MRVASASPRMAAARSSNSPGRAASWARPFASRSASVSTQPSALGRPSNVTTWRRAGSSPRRDASFATCSSFSANATTAPESERMNAHSSASDEG
jgi:hypothetical protein